MKYDDEDAQGFDPTGEIPVVSPVDPRVTIVGAEIASEVAEPVEEESILPHWTEAPTGQIPAVLSRESDAVVDDPWASIPAPAWREGEADWVAHDEQFDPSLLGDAVVAEDKQPWEFNEEPVVDEEELLHEAPRPAPTRAQRTRRPARENPLEGRAARAGTQKNIPVAIATGLLAAAAVILIFMLGTIPVMVLISAALVLACVEAFAAFRAVGAHPATLLGIVGTLALSITSYNRGEAAMPLVTALFLFFTVLWYLGAEKKVDVLDGVGATVFVYAWIGILGSFAALMVSPINYPNKHGLAFLIGAIILTVANDTGALFAGRALGRRKLAPDISPGKTVEGLIGGTVVSLLFAAIILPMISPWTMKDALIIGVAIAIVAPIGDLFESMVKRTLGLKDMGQILPGHGGVLDRVDGLLFALPVTYYLVHVLHLG